MTQIIALDHIQKILRRAYQLLKPGDKKQSSDKNP